MEFRRASLVETAVALRSGAIDVAEYAADTLRLVADSDALVHDLVPEGHRDERVLADAAALAARYPDPSARPPLYGVPVGIKDLFRVDSFPTRAGSFLPPELFAGTGASVVTRIKALGALILGKTETDEFAYSEPPVTRNPRNLKHTPGGSSGGSAAAVALGLTPFSMGTQTLRSIIGPASFCGIVGYKPSWDTVPADGLVFMSPSIDTIGFLAQDVASVALAAELVAGVKPLTPARRPVVGALEGIMRRSLEPDADVAYGSGTRSGAVPSQVGFSSYHGCKAGSVGEAPPHTLPTTGSGTEPRRRRFTHLVGPRRETSGKLRSPKAAGRLATS